MAVLPARSQQIAQTHAQLIHAIVRACQNRALLPELEPVLAAAISNGWEDLVRVIRKILGGDRSPSLLQGLDDEDSVIVEVILRGLQDPASLPDLKQQADPGMAAPGLAFMIHAATTGDPGALEMLGHMAAQMQQAGGDMARLGAAISRMVQGEIEPEKLVKGMDTRGEKLVLDILTELASLRAH
jgi:hypothetical protein